MTIYLIVTFAATGLFDHLGAFTRWHLQYPDIYDYIVPENVFTDVGIPVLSSDVYHLIDRKDPSRDIRTEAKSHFEDDAFKYMGLWSRVRVSYNLENGQEVHAFVSIYKNTASARKLYPYQAAFDTIYQEIPSIGENAVLYQGHCSLNACVYFFDKNIGVTIVAHTSEIDKDTIIAFADVYRKAIPLQ